MTHDLGENVHRGLELKRHWSSALDFLGRCRFRAIVRDGSGFDNYRRFRQQFQHCLAHLFSRLDLRNLGCARWRQRGGAADQQHTRSTARGCFGQSVSHASAGTVGEIAYGVDFFSRRAGSN